MRLLASSLLAAGLAAFAAGCGGARMDAGEPKGTFKVQVAGASFPASQSISQPTRLVVRVHNADTKAVPDVAVTVETRTAGAGGSAGSFSQTVADPTLADDQRPVWILDQGPKNGETAATNTWAVGRLGAGQTRELTWRLTPVRAGRYTVSYRVSPGVFGRARPAAGRTRGSFDVTIDARPVPARVDDNGNVVRGQEAGQGGGSSEPAN